MKKWSIALAVAFTCATAAMLFSSFLGSSHAKYQGRTVKEWSLRLYALGKEREDAVIALQTLGERAVPQLVRLLRKSDLPWRKHVSGAVPSMPAILRPAVLRAYGQPASELKVAAARALAILGPKAAEATSALESRMRDKDPAVANEAALALAQVSQECVPRFETALNDRNPNARRAAAYALGGLGTKAAPAVPGLLRALSDPELLVRQSAEGSLWRIGAAAIPGILDFISREHGPTRERLADGLERMYWGPSPPAPGIASISHDDLDLQKQRAEALKKLNGRNGDARLSGVLVSMLNDPAPSLRVAAMESLHGVQLPGVVIALIRRLQDEDPCVRAEAARSLGILGPAARSALPKLRALVNDPQEPVRLAAESAVARLQDGEPQP